MSGMSQSSLSAGVDRRSVRLRTQQKKKGRLATAFLVCICNHCFAGYWAACSARQPMTLVPVIVTAMFANA
jgi:hypothetical protein